MKEGGCALITGGAGFIGSHLTERLATEKSKVKVYDNLSTGTLENIKPHMDKVAFIHGDLLNPSQLDEAVEDSTIIYHLAANPEVRVGVENTKIDFEQNLKATYNLLEAMRKSEKADTLIFTSTSTIYGEPTIIPTPEDYAPLTPISMYGASKLGCEALISAYSHLFDINAVIYRFANVVGPRSRHGVVYDFFKKLKENNKELEILGDGSQSKSYLYIEDCIDAILKTRNRIENKVEIINIGTKDRVDVKKIAQIVVEEMGLKNVKFRFTGGEEGRGWRGDVKLMQLSIEKAKGFRWRPKYNSEETIRMAVRSLINELEGRET